MITKILSPLVLAFILSSFPAWVDAQSLGAGSGKSVQSVGKSKLGARKQTRPNNMPGKNVNSNPGRDQVLGYNFSKSRNDRRDHGDVKDNWQIGNDNRHGNYHHDKGNHKFNPLYAPFYYFGYYGYAPYNGYYAYADPDYPLGYGTTMGTSLERPSNLEINRFNENPPVPEDYRQDNSGAGNTYIGPAEDAVVEFYYPPPSEEQTIYVWVDESGVPNYVNDIDLVPLRYRDIATILGAE